ncbi:MAG: hypothetical protein ABIG39_06315 [Candidatus Micrarchaeota archaeon]
MKDMKLGLVIASLVLLVAVVGADTMLTAVYFNVPSSISFTVTVPGESAAAGATTPDIGFNSSIPTATKINCSCGGGSETLQDDNVPCFNYTNTGNRAINLSVQFGSALPAGVRTKAGHNASAYEAECTCSTLPTGCTTNACVFVNDTLSVKVADIAYGGYEEVWFWADFANVTGGTDTNRTLIHISQASS